MPGKQSGFSKIFGEDWSMPRTQLACLRAFSTRRSQPLYDVCPSQVGRSGIVLRLLLYVIVLHCVETVVCCCIVLRLLLCYRRTLTLTRRGGGVSRLSPPPQHVSAPSASCVPLRENTKYVTLFMCLTELSRWKGNLCAKGSYSLFKFKIEDIYT